MNTILDYNAPFKRVNKTEIKTKHWVTPALQKSISVKNTHYLNIKFIKSKDPHIKGHHRIKYKTYRDMLSTLMERSKMNYYNHYFKTNCENMKNNWQGIKSFLSINNNPSHIPKILVSNDTKSTEPIKTATISLLELLLKLKKVLNIPRNTFLIFLKIDLMIPFFYVPLTNMK